MLSASRTPRWMPTTTPKSSKSATKPRPKSATPSAADLDAQAKALADEELAREQQIVSNRLKTDWEMIIKKYSRNFDGIADEWDALTGEIVVDNGHIRGMQNESDKDSDEEVVRWAEFLNPDKKGKNKRKREDDGSGREDGSSKMVKVAQTVDEARESGASRQGEPNGQKAFSPSKGPSLSEGEQPSSQPSSLAPEALSELPSDSYLLAQLGQFGPAVLRALQRSGVPANASSGTDSVSTSMPPPDLPSSAEPNKLEGQTTDAANHVADPVPATPEPRSKKRKPTAIIIPENEVDELSSPATPSLSTIQRKPKFRLKAADSPSIKGKGKASRLSISIAPDELEDELQSHSAPTPVPSSSKLSMSHSKSSKQPSASKTSPSRLPKPTSGTDADPWAIPIEADPFYNPIWDDKHPDGEPEEFPMQTPRTLSLPLRTPLLAESPTIRALKQDARTTPSRSRRASVGTPNRTSPVARKKQKKEPPTPGWTSTPARRESALMDLVLAEPQDESEKIAAKEREAKQCSLVAVEILVRPPDKAGEKKTSPPAAETEKPNGDPNVETEGLSLNKPNDEGTSQPDHIDPAQEPKESDEVERNDEFGDMNKSSNADPPLLDTVETNKPPPAGEATPPPTATEASAPAPPDSEVEIVSVKKTKKMCGMKGFMCSEFCFKCQCAAG
jgi:hypothetical protein